MDRATVIGLMAGFGLLVAAIVLGRVPIEPLLNPEALIIVFGGTITATLVSFSGKTIDAAIRALKTDPARELGGMGSIGGVTDYVMEVVGFVRDEGILALQPLIDTIEIPFLKKGLQLVLDNRTERFIRDSLTTELEVAYREQLDYARVFETAGGFAPTMGIIGAVIGLISVTQSFQDPGQLGQGVAAAFSATLYGVALANLALLPLAGKLRQRARDVWFLRTLLLEAILSIRAGEHPMLIEERLNAFVGKTKTKPYATGQPKGGTGKTPAAQAHAVASSDDGTLDMLMGAQVGGQPYAGV